MQWGNWRSGTAGLKEVGHAQERPGAGPIWSDWDVLRTLRSQRQHILAALPWCRLARGRHKRRRWRKARYQPVHRGRRRALRHTRGPSGYYGCGLNLGITKQGRARVLTGDATWCGGGDGITPIARNTEPTAQLPIPLLDGARVRKIEHCVRKREHCVIWPKTNNTRAQSPSPTHIYTRTHTRTHVCVRVCQRAIVYQDIQRSTRLQSDTYVCV